MHGAGDGPCDSGPAAQDCCPLSCWPGPYWVSALQSQIAGHVMYWLNRWLVMTCAPSRQFEPQLSVCQAIVEACCIHVAWHACQHREQSHHAQECLL